MAYMITLSEYLKREGLNPNKFATIHGMTQPAVRRAEAGKRVSPDVALAITKATKGEVPIQFLLYPQDHEAHYYFTGLDRLFSKVKEVIKEDLSGDSQVK